MPTIYPAEVFDDEAGCTAHGTKSNPGHGQKAFVNPAAAGLERRHAAPRPSREHPVRNASAAPGLTPTQWLAQWCCLEEQT